jgi:hypothetical protein
MTRSEGWSRTSRSLEASSVIRSATRFATAPRANSVRIFVGARRIQLGRRRTVLNPPASSALRCVDDLGIVFGHDQDGMCSLVHR